MKGSVHSHILDAFRERRALLFVLIDPDKTDSALPEIVRDAHDGGVDGFLVGGSLSFGPHISDSILRIKSSTDRPVIIFPGGVHHISPAADAILFLSIISGRNAEQLIGQHVIAAPIIRQIDLEPLSTGYILVESGTTSTAEFMSASKPVPRNKPEIAAAHALAAEYLGMKLLYLEAGSGAQLTVPDAMVQAVRSVTSIPILVGGGISTPREASRKVSAGATVVVIGNHFETEEHRRQFKEFADAVHTGTWSHTTA